METRLYRPAYNSLDAVVLRLIRVLNETLATEFRVPVVSARVWIYSHPFIPPFHLFVCGWHSVLSLSLQIPSHMVGFVHISSTSCFTHASVSLKLCGFMYLLCTTKSGFTYQAAIRELHSKWI